MAHLKKMKKGEKLINEKLETKDMWTLVWLGVLPEFQCKGFGTKLLEPVLSMADAENKKCVTWFFESKNLDFFQRIGFKAQFKLNVPEIAECTVVVRNPISKK